MAQSKYPLPSLDQKLLASLGVTVQKIKNLEIQGAESIACAATQAFGEVLKTCGKTASPDCQSKLEQAIKMLENARPTEPALRNALKYCLMNYEKDADVVTTVLNHFKISKEKIVEFGSQKIRSGMTVFTHCHSSTVTGILVKAWKEGKKFQVFQTETRPRYQGRLTAKELAEVGIPVTHSVDSAGRLLMQKADMFLFGSDSVTAEGTVINKIGTLFLAEVANDHDIPVYACTNSWKFNPETIEGKEEVIEERDPKEVWEDAPAGIQIFNPAFEITPADKITGIITELGVFKPETLVTEIQKSYPWMF